MGKFLYYMQKLYVIINWKGIKGFDKKYINLILWNGKSFEYEFY